MEETAATPRPKKRMALPNVFRQMAGNPIILKELRGRMRGRRAFLFLTIYLIVVSLFVSAIYAVLAAQINASPWDPSSRQNAGKAIFGSVVLFEFLLIGFIGPALTAGAVTSERERQTYDLLRTTLLSARALVFGKLGSACMYLVLLIFTAVPIEALAFLLGGVGLEELLVSGLLLLVNTVFCCALGLFCSSFSKRTLTATVTSYAIILLSVLGLGVTAFVITYLMSTFLSNVNPSSSDSLAYVLIGILWLMSATNPFSAAIVSEIFLIQDQTLFLIRIPASSSFGTTLYLPSPWTLHVLFYAVLTALMIFLSIQFVKRPDR
jgi:ABC-2 type transport system permease protein